MTILQKEKENENKNKITMKQKTKHLQSFLLLLLMTVMSTANAWATDPVVTYTYESSATKATLADNGYFSAASNPTASNSNCEFSSNTNGLTCTLKTSTSSTVTFTFTAKTSFELESFTINSYTNSSNIKNATVDYYKGSNEPTNTSVEFATSSLGNKTITPTSPISLSNGDVFTIKVNLTNNDASNTRHWRINTITLTPVAASTYTVTYDGQSPASGSAPTDTSSPYAAGSNVTVLGNTGNMTKSYKDFVGWNTSTSGTVSTHYNAGDTYSSISSDVTFYAVWHNRITYSVAAGQGSVSAVYGTGGDTYYGKSAGNTFNSGDHVPNYVVLTFTATPATGYHFDTSIDKPWGGTSDKSNPITWTVKDTKGFDAHFAANTYTVTIDENTGSAGDANVTATYDAALPSFIAPTKAGNTLSGYYTETSGGTKIINANGTLVTGVAGYTDGSGNWKHDGDVKLYAQWEAAATYSVTYDANLTGFTGSVPTDATAYAEGASVTVADKGTLAKDGYTFLGWSTALGYQSTYYTADQTFTMGTANVTLYAQWKLNSSLVSSDPAPGAGTLATGAAVYTTATSPATGMYAEQAATAFDFATLKNQTLKGLTGGWTNNSSNAGGTQTLSVLLTDGTFYSDVIPFTYTVGVATPAISCSSNTVTITCATTGATIYYTTDGTPPSASNGTEYSTSFPIYVTTTVKAIAIKNATNSAVASQACTYGTSITDLPVTIDFGASPFSTSTDFSGASGSTMSLTQNSHEVYFHGSNDSEFSIVSGSPNALRMNSNGATNHFIAIPMSNINGRIDIEIWAPYAQSSSFTIRAVLDTNHGTTVQSAAPSAIKTAALDVNDYKDGHFYFRMKDLTATEGVLYIGPASSSYKDFQKIKVTSPAHYLIPDKASVTMGDGSEPETVTITNYSAYPVLVKTVPSYVTATFEPSTGVLVITPKAIGTEGAIELAVDTDGDGIATDTDLSIPVTVTGITIDTQPVSAVYATGATPDALTVSATHSGSADMTYQWYKNTVNSTEGGEAISGATTATLATGNIDTSASENASFYYCVVSAENSKSKTSDVAYVLTSKTKRYFQMSNVAGNRQTSTNDEKITGQVIAGGKAYVQTDGDYRYITRPNTSNPHMYVAKNTGKYFKIELDKDNAIATDDQISVRLLGYNGASSGIIITDGTNQIPITQTDDTEKTYTATFPSTFNGKTTLYVKGIYNSSLANYFTDLIFSKPTDLSVTGPTPASQSVQSGETPAAFTVTATGGTGSYTYEWKQDTSAGGSFSTDAEGTVVSDGGTSTFTPTSKSVASNTNYYYKCIVTSGGSNRTTSAATLTVTTLTHGYYTPDFSEKDTVVYILYDKNYTSQNTGPTSATDHYWKLDSSIGTSARKITWINNLLGKGSDFELTYYKLDSGSNKKYMEFYVKNAKCFAAVVEPGSSNKQYKLTIDGGETQLIVADKTKLSEKFDLNPLGSLIRLEYNDTGMYPGCFVFYKNLPATITVLKNGEAVTEATQYMGDGATEYEVETNGDGALSLVKPTGATDVTNGYRTTYAEVTLNDGILSVTPRAATPTNPSTPEEITIKHKDGTSYADASTTLNVTVKKHTLALAFSYEKASFKASTLTESTVIPSGSLPTLTATLDGEAVNIATLGIQYKTDDRTIGYFGDTDSPASSRSADGTSYAVKYGGGQGGARIYAYVDNQLNHNYSSAKASFDLVVEAGTSNAIPKGISIAEQQVFNLANSAGVEVVKLTYGGYKYNPEGGWYNSVSRGEYYIDGYQYYTRHGMDALDEYGYQLRGMSDEAEAAPDGSKSGDKITVTKKKAKKDGESSVTFDVYKYSSQNVGAHTFWYKSDGSEKRPDGQNYLPYQRIRPFTLPTRGGYLKFEPKQTGKLTVYVWQNGQMESKDKSNPDRVGSKPRLGYWFDQDGWVQHPAMAPITKQPITSSSYGSNTWGGGVRTIMENTWKTADDIPAINMLTYKYCNDAEDPQEYYPESGVGHTDLNPYYWKTSGEIDDNLDEEKTIISEKMTPVPFHNGYMVPENSYLKYVINVVAGKTYYFYGMMTKIGYVGMNFVEDDNVTISDTGKKFYHQTTTLHLNANDNMATVVANSAQGDANTYLGTVYDEVTLPSNYKKNQWSTICLPFPLSESQVEEAFGKGTQLTIYNGARKKGTGVYSIRYLSHVDRNILAGQPYFIKPSGVDANGVDLENVGGVIGSAVEGAPDTKTRITFNTVCIDANFSTTTTYGSDEDVNASGTDIHQEGYKFVGAYNNETLPTYSYIVSKGELRRFTGSTTKIPTYYAYLKPNTSASQSGSYSLTVDFNEENVENAWVADSEDEPTGVISMEAIADAMNNGKVLSGKAYNMMGQEVDPTSAKGIVIIDGKKYMFK